MICDRCNQELLVGEWPFCPHGFPFVGVSVVDDQIEGGPRFFETLGHDPVWIESKSQLRREADLRGKVNVVKHDSAYYVKQRKMHDEKLHDMGSAD